MKKIYLLLLLLPLSLNILSNDRFYVKDSICIYRWDQTLNNWIYTQRINFFYDSTRKLIEKTYYQWDPSSSNWGGLNMIMCCCPPIICDTGGRTVYSYNVNGNLDKKIWFIWDTQMNDWTMIKGHTYTYDPTRNLTNTYTFKWNSVTKRWENCSWELYFRNQNSSQIIKTIHKWDPENNIWFPCKCEECYYNANGNPTEFIFYDWDSKSCEWIKKERENWTYNERGNLTENKCSVWDNETNCWITRKCDVFTYDTNENLTEELNMSLEPETNTWAYNYIKFIYNGNTTITEQINILWNPGTDMYLKSYKRVDYTYDLEGNITEEMIYRWDSEINEWQPYEMKLYYWSVISTTIPGNSLENVYTVYPNPFTDYTTISLPDSEATKSVEIIDSYGRIVRTVTDIESNRVTIYRENLPAGIYFIRISGDYLFTTKVIII